MEPSNGSAPAAMRPESTDKANLHSKPFTGDKQRTNSNAETVRSLTSKLESSLTLNSATSIPVPINENSSVYRNVDVSNKVNPNDLHHANNNSENLKANISKLGTTIPNRVFVGGIPLDATEHDVRQLFAKYGNICSVKIISDRAGVSKGYGFVTYESEECAQRVIKEAENLIVKNRRLNVSPAVMKYQQNSFDFRVLPNGSFVYPQFPFSPTTAANLPQYFPDNFHSSMCAAEGYPIYQIAGVNGHFMSNYPSFLSSPAQFLTQTAASFASPYQGLPGCIYPGVSPPGPSLPMSSQHSLFHSQSQPGQHLMSGGSLPNAHGFPYSTACSSQTASNPNSPALHALRYPPTLSHTSPGQAFQSVNLNGSGNPQYIQFSNATSPTMNGHPGMHLATTMPIHPLQLNQISEVSNPSGSANSVNASAQMNPTLLHHAHHSAPSMYPNYSANMPVTPQLTSNANSNVHMKPETATGMEMYENMPPSIMNGHVMNPSVTNSSGASIATLPTAIQLNNGSYVIPQMLEVIWPSSHVSNSAPYGSNATMLGPSNVSNNEMNCKSHQALSNNRNSSIPPATVAANSSSNGIPKSSHPILSNGHLPNSTSVTSNSVPASTMSTSLNPANSNINSSKEKISNSRHSSYGASHNKKMHNGNSHGYSSNNNNNNISNSSKSKMMNGNIANSRLQSSNPVEPHTEHSSVDQTLILSGPTTKQPPQHFPKHNNNNQQPQQLTSNTSSNGRCSSNGNATTATSGSSQQNFVTKTVNGVEILCYALTGNGEVVVSGEIGSNASSTTTPPPRSPCAVNSVPA